MMPAMDADLRAAFEAGPLVQPLPPPEREALAGRTEERRLAAGEVLFRQGEPAERAYQVVRGQVKLTQLAPSGEEVSVALLADGDLFAVAAAFAAPGYPVTATAMLPTRLLAWRGDVLADVMARYPTVSFEATRVISGRTWQLQERFREVATLPVPARLARALLRLAEHHGEPAGGAGGKAVALRLRLSRQDLAQITGTTLYTVSRVLSEWRQQGLLELGRERVVLTDPERLAEQAESAAGG